MSYERFDERHSFNVLGFIQLLYDTTCVNSDFWVNPVWGLGCQSNLFAGEVAGGENNSNLFYTPPATYLPLLLLRQPISKSYSRCPSLLSLVVGAFNKEKSL